MRYIFIYIFLFTGGFDLKAQDATFGITFGGTLYEYIDWDRAMYKAPNSYHTYVEDGEGNGLISKHSFLNGVHFGIVSRLKYKRFTAAIEPGYFYQRIYLNFERPFFVERIVGKRAFRLPVYFTYKLFKSAKSPFLLGGFNLVKENNWDFSAPGFSYYYGDADSYNLQFDIGDDHFEGILYDNSWYWNYMLGFGITFDTWQYSFRVQQRVARADKKLEAKILQVEMTVNIDLFAYKDFTKKHFLYVD